MAHRRNKKRISQDDIERTAKRQEHKDAGVLDGRYRERVVPSKKVYDRSKVKTEDRSTVGSRVE